jgi:1-acyl-sn-glycerol-3-phosphate acyltransferase
MLQRIAASAIRLASGVRIIPEAALPAGPFVIFANHASHLDFAVIWAALPARTRGQVRPVAGRDYWEKTRLRRWLAGRVFQAILIERQRVTVASNPLEPMLAALDGGCSLIVFPEGTRSLDGVLQPFKPGLYHLAHARPQIPLIPVHLENLNRILPKGEFLFVPLIASLSLSPPITLQAGETKQDFLSRAHAAISALQHPPE